MGFLMFSLWYLLEGRVVIEGNTIDGTSGGIVVVTDAAKTITITGNVHVAV